MPPCAVRHGDGLRSAGRTDGLSPERDRRRRHTYRGTRSCPGSVTDRETAGAATLTFSVAVLVVVLLGVNDTFTVQLARMARPGGPIGQLLF